MCIMNRVAIALCEIGIKLLIFKKKIFKTPKFKSREKDCIRSKTSVLLHFCDIKFLII